MSVMSTAWRGDQRLPQRRRCHGIATYTLLRVVFRLFGLIVGIHFGVSGLGSTEAPKLTPIHPYPVKAPWGEVEKIRVAEGEVTGRDHMNDS